MTPASQSVSFGHGMYSIGPIKCSGSFSSEVLPESSLSMQQSPAGLAVKEELHVVFRVAEGRTLVSIVC